jgi:hypothetical protein
MSWIRPVLRYNSENQRDLPNLDNQLRLCWHYNHFWNLSYHFGNTSRFPRKKGSQNAKRGTLLGELIPKGKVHEEVHLFKES